MSYSFKDMPLETFTQGIAKALEAEIAEEIESTICDHIMPNIKALSANIAKQCMENGAVFIQRKFSPDADSIQVLVSFNGEMYKDKGSDNA